MSLQAVVRMWRAVSPCPQVMPHKVLVASCLLLPLQVPTVVRSPSAAELVQHMLATSRSVAVPSMPELVPLQQPALGAYRSVPAIAWGKARVVLLQ